MLETATRHQTRLDCVRKRLFSHGFPFSLSWWHLRSSRSQGNSCYPVAPPTLRRLRHKLVAGWCEALTKIFWGGVSPTNLGSLHKTILRRSMVCPRSLHGHVVLVFSVNMFFKNLQNNRPVYHGHESGVLNLELPLWESKKSPMLVVNIWVWVHAGVNQAGFQLNLASN